MARRFFGFYRSYPLPRLGFTYLPNDDNAAAALSRTIFYQRDLLRGFVTKEVSEKVVLGLSGWNFNKPRKVSLYNIYKINIIY